MQHVVQITMPKDLVHHGGVEHREVHNLFGKLYHEATADGLVARGAEDKEKPHGDRSFVLSRAFFAGTQTVRLNNGFGLASFFCPSLPCMRSKLCVHANITNHNF